MIDINKNLNDFNENWQSIYFIFFTLSLCDNDFEISEESLNVLNDIEIFDLRVKDKRSHLSIFFKTSKSFFESLLNSFISTPS